MEIAGKWRVRRIKKRKKGEQKENERGYIYIYIYRGRVKKTEATLGK